VIEIGAVSTASVEQTRELGEALADVARPGDVVVLAGELGTGKTALAQGFARGLGVAEPVTSPTFTLARTYEGRLRLHHVDVYRLDHLQEAEDLGLAELVDDGGVTLVEWGDVIAPALPAGHLEVRLAYGEAVDDRLLHLSAAGRPWALRADALRRLLSSWSGGRWC
jgi:tRNA threonylcarbamoyladenosine biosynthesis protein TsaE